MDLIQNQQIIPAYIQKNNWKYARSKTFETAFEADCDNCELSLECHWYAAEGNTEKMAIEEKIQRNIISTADISELTQWLLSSNPEEAKALQNSLNAEAPLKDWSRERLRELENQQPLDSNLILRLEGPTGNVQKLWN